MTKDQARKTFTTVRGMLAQRQREGQGPAKGKSVIAVWDRFDQACRDGYAQKGAPDSTVDELVGWVDQMLLLFP